MKWLLLLLLILFQNTYANESTSLRILSLSDIHFNPFITCPLTKKSCPLIDELQKTNAHDWSLVFQKMDTQPQPRLRDTGYSLLISSLNKAKSVAKEDDVQLVIVLGDHLAHEYKRLFNRYSKDKSELAYRHFVNQTIEFLFQQLSLTFQNTPIYIAIGNNDTYQKNYASQPKGQFFKDTAKDAAQLIPANQRNNFMMQFQNAGYYSINLEKNSSLTHHKIRLLMLNSVLFSSKAKGDGISDAALEELVWLKKQLNLAKSQNEKVIIAMHIPPVYDFYITPTTHVMTIFNFWNKKYINQFDHLLQEFSQQIIAVISGHQHADQLKYMSLKEGVEIPIIGTSSISPIFGNDPQFSVYTFSLANYQLTGNDLYTQKIWDQ